jgi:hypothetical protein
MLRVFGCAWWPNLRPYNSRMLEFRSKRCTFLGYSTSHKGFKCLDIAIGRIYISGDVVFDENIFPFADLHPNAGMRFSSELLLLPDHLRNLPGGSIVPDPVINSHTNATNPSLVSAENSIQNNAGSSPTGPCFIQYPCMHEQHSHASAAGTIPGTTSSGTHASAAGSPSAPARATNATPLSPVRPREAREGQPAYAPPDAGLDAPPGSGADVASPDTASRANVASLDNSDDCACWIRCATGIRCGRCECALPCSRSYSTASTCISSDDTVSARDSTA